MSKMFRKSGLVYRGRLFGTRTVLGPEANELVEDGFDRDRNFSSSNGWGFLLDRLFPYGLVLMDSMNTACIARRWVLPFAAGWGRTITTGDLNGVRARGLEIKAGAAKLRVCMKWSGQRTLAICIG